MDFHFTEAHTHEASTAKWISFHRGTHTRSLHRKMDFISPRHTGTRSGTKLPDPAFVNFLNMQAAACFRFFTHPKPANLLSAVGAIAGFKDFPLNMCE